MVFLMDVKFGQSEDTLSAACLKNCRIQYQTGLRYRPFTKVQVLSLYVWAVRLWRNWKHSRGWWDKNSKVTVCQWDVPVAQGHYFCHRAGAFWSFGEETPHTPSLMQQTCPLTCCRSTAFCGSRKEMNSQFIQRTTQSYTRRWSILRTTPPQNNTSRGCPVLTPRAGRWPAKTSWPRWAPWIRWRWTSSLAEGSVQKWSEVFSFVYSRAHGPTKRQHTHTRSLSKHLMLLISAYVMENLQRIYDMHLCARILNSWLNFDQITLLERILHC